jgi:PAS domain S-box-containing protein
MVDGAMALLAYVDDQERYQFSNILHDEWLGVAPGSALGKPVREVLGEHGYAAVRDRIRRALQGERQEYEIEWQHPAMGRRYLSVTYSPEVRENGHVAGFVACAVDVTARREAELRALREREHLYELFNHAPAAIAILHGPDHVYALSNPINNEALGRDPTGLSVRQALPDMMDQGYGDFLDRVYRTGEPFSMREARAELRGSDGSAHEIFLDFVYQPMRGTDGRVEGVLVFGFDVTQKVLARRLAEESARRLALLARVSRALAEARLELGAIFDAIVKPLAEETGDGAVLHMVAPGGRLELAALEHRDHDAKAAMEQLLRAVPLHVGEGIAGRAAASGQSILMPAIDQDALRAATRPEYAPFLARFPIHGILAVPIRAQGEVIGALSISRYGKEHPLTEDDRALLEDVADRAALAILNARHHRELRESERSFRALAEAIPQLVWTTLPDGEADYFNQRWYDFTGLTPAQSLGFAWKAALHPDDVQPLSERWTRSLETGEPYESECRFRRASDGEYRWMIARAVPIEDAAGTIAKWFGTCTDIHAQKESEHAQAEAVKVRDDFLSIAGHELRTPLTALQLQVESLQRLAAREEAPPARLVERLGKMAQHVARLEGLISELLNVSRITAGRLEIHLEQVELVALVADVAERFAPQLAAAGCTLAIDAPREVTGEWDRHRLDQVITNLLGNAIKYGEGTPIAVTIGGTDEHARLEVRDQGIGIPRADQERVFERFERAVSDRHYGGLGLGLWITRQAVEAHRGTIRVESKPGEGTTFFVELPRRRPA